MRGHLCGVIGNPVTHSLSPQIFQAFATQTNQPLVYHKITAPIGAFAATVHQFQQQGGLGLNVTLPFKHEAYLLATEKSCAVKDACAASVLHFRAHQIIYADNFDGLGLVQDLTQNCQIPLKQKKILIIGSGGAARGILGPLLDQQPAEIIIANRTTEKATQLAAQFQLRGPVRGVGFDELIASARTPVDLIIHATSAGHQENKLQGLLSTLLPRYIAPHTNFYDISYGHAAQAFRAWTKTQTAGHCYDGLGMLVMHNAAVFHLWFGIYPDVKPVLNLLRPEF